MKEGFVLDERLQQSVQIITLQSLVRNLNGLLTIIVEFDLSLDIFK